MMGGRPAILAAVILLGLGPWASTHGLAAEKDRKGRKLDVFWTHPDIANLPLRSVALLPAATYDNNLKAEKEVEAAWGPFARTTGLRWYFSTTAKDLLRRAFGGDSVVAALRAQLLREPRVDSLAAQRLCRALHTSAVLSMRVDLWEQVLMEWNQAGKPWTTVQIKAALVDSTGRLLWTASGSETGEGPMHQPESATLGVRSSGLKHENITGQGGAPSFGEVLSQLFGRWREHFPAAEAAPPAAAGGP